MVIIVFGPDVLLTRKMLKACVAVLNLCTVRNVTNIHSLMEQDLSCLSPFGGLNARSNVYVYMKGALSRDDGCTVLTTVIELI
jgi:hypothetical protein